MFTKPHVNRPNRSRTVALWVALMVSAAIGACTTAPLQLNSERIATQFGSYQVSVLQQDDAMRVSSLASKHDDRLITRTLAIVLFEPENEAYAAEHELIKAGGSIGSTFRNGGWQIHKPLLYTGALPVQSDSRIISTLMEIDLPAELAVHAYRFDVSQYGETFTYATLFELHHPDYLGEAMLTEIYGSVAASDGDQSLAALFSTVRTVLRDLSMAAAP